MLFVCSIGTVWRTTFFINTYFYSPNNYLVMKKEHQNYLTPSVETMKVRVEKGFAGSGGGGSTSGFPGLPGHGGSGNGDAGGSGSGFPGFPGRQGLPFT